MRVHRPFRPLDKLIAGFVSLLFLVALVDSQEAEKHGLGYIPPKPAVVESRHKMSNAIHARKLMALPDATEAEYDAVAIGYIINSGNQGGCGDCHEWSAVRAAQNAFLRAGNKDTGPLSVQYMLDYYPQLGGCQGGDEYTDAQVILQHGIPSLKDYPGAGQSPGPRRPTTGMTMHKITSIVYADPSRTDGVSSTQALKNAIKNNGYVSVAASAAPWNNPGTGVLRGRGGQVDHAIGAVGWRTNPVTKKTEFKGMNQWGDGWGFTFSAPGNPGNGGSYFWIEEGSFSWGTASFFVTVAQPPIPPVEFTPPFVLWDATHQISEGSYPKLADAMFAAQGVADRGGFPVVVKDANGVLAATLTPTVTPPDPVPDPTPDPTPIPQPCTPTWHLFMRGHGSHWYCDDGRRGLLLRRR